MVSVGLGKPVISGYITAKKDVYRLSMSRQAMSVSGYKNKTQNVIFNCE